MSTDYKALADTLTRSYRGAQPVPLTNLMVRAGLYASEAAAVPFVHSIGSRLARPLRQNGWTKKQQRTPVGVQVLWWPPGSSNNVAPPYSPLEESFELMMRQDGGIPQWQRELKFAPPRRWRFDFAWPQQKVAVEIDGGVRQRVGHLSPAGYLSDCEKYEAALLLGWRVYRVPGPWVQEGELTIWRPQMLTTLKKLLRTS